MFSIVTIHAVAGVAAIIGGAGALAAPKGRAVHVASGRVFVAAMAVSSLLGATLGLLNAASFYITFHAGLLALYLVGSGWLAARRPDGGLRAWAGAPAVLNLLNVTALAALSLYAARSGGQFLGFGAADYGVLCVMGALAGAADLSLLFRSGLGPGHRIARHLWRMCLGFFIAAGSAFTGPGAEAFPQAIRQSGVLALPELAILLLLLFWLARTYWRSSRSRAAGRA